MATSTPIRMQPRNLHLGDGAQTAAIMGFLPHRLPVGGTGLGFPALPFAVGAGATVFGDELVVVGYTRGMIVATTAVAMGLTIRHLNPATGAVSFTETAAGVFVAATSSLVPFGDGSANFTTRVWARIQLGFNNATAGAANVTALEGLWLSAP